MLYYQYCCASSLPSLFRRKVICPGVSSRDTSALDITAVSSAPNAQAELGGSGVGVAGGGSGGGGVQKGALTGKAVLTEASRLLTNMTAPSELVYFKGDSWPVFLIAF